MPSLSVRYAFDDALRARANAEGRNYWYAYVAEILSRLGVCARPFPLQACAEAAALAEVGVLVLGDFAPDTLPAQAARALNRWVSDGGVLIGFATEGVDEVFGVAGEGAAIAQADPFAVSAYLDLLADPVTADCRACVDLEQKLLIVSPVRRVRAQSGRHIARLFACDPAAPGDGSLARNTGLPAIVHHALGKGHAFYFAFNVAQTMWTIQQGRPVEGDYDGDGYLRVFDACIVGRNRLTVPYTDALHFLLANMIGRRPTPMIDQMPPRDGKAPPALLHFAGDDEGRPGHQAAASDFMAARGLPYHINAMPVEGAFAFDADEQARIEANGHEIGLHYDFVNGFDHPCGFASDDVAAQAALFRRRFGRDSVCSVMHYVRWTGWAEPARWMQECGGRADNSFFGWQYPPLNPVNTIGFSFGSAFPRFFYDNAAHGNARINLIEIPITAYEVGYEDEAFLPERISHALSLAVRHRLTFSFFWHPVYLAKSPACRQAVDELVRLIGLMPSPPVLMGTDALCHWWQARAGAVVDHARQSGGGVSFEAECRYRGGFIVKAPTGASPPGACRVDGVPARCEQRREFGQYWTFIPLAAGRHAIELALQPVP